MAEAGHRDYVHELDHAAPALAHAKLGSTLQDIINAHNNASLAKAGLAIHGASSAVVKSTAPIFALVGGAPVRKAPADLSALAGTLATGKSALWAFYIDASGTITTSAKTADAATHDAALALMPAVPAGKAMFGFIVVDNATGSGFVGGTTALDTGSLTVTYYDVTGAAIPLLALGAR